MIDILQGDCRDVLAMLPAASVQTCVTSPPYFGLRAYLPDGHPDKAREVGAEPSPDEFVAAMVEVFRAVRRVLRDDGSVWLNLGDSYASSGIKSLGRNDAGRNFTGGGGNKLGSGNPGVQDVRRFDYGAKPKDLLMIPARVALALQADGWWLRSHIIWAKPNPMPESVRDRPTNAHESVFLLTKRPAYFYDAEAVAEPRTAENIAHGLRYKDLPRKSRKEFKDRADGGTSVGQGGFVLESSNRNLRNVWTIPPNRFRGAHFATMPSDLVERCIKAGSRPGDTVLDPFGGAGTTGLVASRLGRNATLIELNPDYCTLARGRIDADAGLLAAD